MNTFEVKNKEKIGVLGVGNLVLSDEGFGIHVIRELESRYSFDPSIELIDGGTAGISLMGLIEGLKKLIVIDCLDLDEPPGSIRVFDKKDIINAPGVRFSPHQIGLLEVLDLLKMNDNSPNYIKFIGVVGRDISPGIRLSKPLQDALPKVCELVLGLLRGFNIKIIS